ncbi:MAG: Holliday junction ATP-dependent DNA helicase RuvA [Candidatus Tectimicrobiota bacterium]|nr:MAG: Holliday junction ATP-dependent DNA helicase RuvA [Candidatus Tectomicrobia bacterium]
MIAQVRGLLLAKSLEQVVVDVQGVGYRLFIPLSTYLALPPLQQPVTLLTTLLVRDDALRLYGFATAEERTLFELLLTVASIGPRLALNVLSALSAAEVQQAIACGDVARLQAIPGIGRKTAERIVLELQEKVAAPVPAPRPGLAVAEPLVGDVVSALLNLGYKRSEAERAVQRAQARRQEAWTLEALLKASLQQLAQTS